MTDVPDWSTIAAFSAATIALLLIPGPAILYILNRSVSDGREVGLAAVAGLEVGDAIQVMAAAAGRMKLRQRCRLQQRQTVLEGNLQVIGVVQDQGRLERAAQHFYD